MNTRTDLHLQLVRQAAERRRESEQHFRAMIATARAASVPLTPIAEAAGLSVARIHAILKEELMQTYAPRTTHAAATHDVVVVAAKLAYKDYLDHAAYICQPGRSFQDVGRLGFYRRGTIERHFPAIRAIEDHVLFTHEHATELRATGSRVDHEIADLIDNVLPNDEPWHREGQTHKVFLLTAHDDPQTLTLPEPIRHDTAGRGSAWTMGQRYASEEALRRNPRTTDEL